ncbi:Ribosomal RNA small subunit methyltransferase A [Hyphomicrobium sp. 1Nfss2.1]|uniref:16S rRNA (adenine(1518)-N(6)/adenine(1519)-N(6))- dimethyltransferase RsmA n=1 Tax=Hyphomicrobium sp. 1Nfss2.1 TaxID=3413936 RepID=UPI003C7C3127
MTSGEREISGASPDGLPPLREVIRAFGLEAKKSLGQNFILDLNLTRRIARAAGSLAGRTVVEVGPGPGGLTRALLLEGAERVVAVERDERARGPLEMIAQRYPGQLEVHFGDALEADWPKLVGAARGKAVIVANLPYGVATLLLTGWLDSEPWPPWFDRMVLMFQKEVAERIVAAPNSKAYGRLSVLSQWRSAPRIVFNVPREAFTPAPKVESAVVEFIPHKEPNPPCTPRVLAQVTAAAFGQRRKMLRASLKQLTPEAEQLLEAAGIAGNLRAEDLTVKDFARMALVFERSGLGRR